MSGTVLAGHRGPFWLYSQFVSNWAPFFVLRWWVTTFFLKHLRTLENALTKAYGYPQYIDQLYILSHKTTAESGLPPQWFELLDGRGEGFESGQIEPGWHFFFCFICCFSFHLWRAVLLQVLQWLATEKKYGWHAPLCCIPAHIKHEMWLILLSEKKDPSHYITMKLQLILMQLLCFPS